MVMKYVKITLLIAISTVCIYLFFGSINIKVQGTAMRKDEKIIVNYEVDNNSIMPLTLYKEHVEDAFVEIQYYDSNRKSIRVDDVELKDDVVIGVIAKGEKYTSSKQIVESDDMKSAMYIRLKVRVDRNKAQDKKERTLCFIRKNKLYSDYILID